MKRFVCRWMKMLKKSISIGVNNQSFVISMENGELIGRSAYDESW